MDSENLLASVNKNGKNLQVNVQIITLEDNLSHPYFSLLEIAEENTHPLGIAKVEMPYEPQIFNYWTKYYGTVIASFNMSDYQIQNTNAESYIQKFALKNKIINDSYNYSLICKVSRLKQKGKKIIIYLENLGWKFLQKVPKDFRDTFVANQSLDDAFQAICEFLGVQFAYSIEDLHEYNFASNGYSIEKAGETVEDTETILSRWIQTKDEPKVDEEETEETQENNQTPTTEEKNQNDKSVASNATNSTEETETSETPEETDDIQEKVEKNKEDFENKILDLFRGNTYYDSDLSNPIMNYDSITITPKAPEPSASDTSNMSTVGDSNSENGNSTDGTNSSDGVSKFSGSAGVSIPASKFSGSAGVSVTSAIELSVSYIRGLSTAMAATMAKNPKYTTKTRVRLIARSKGQFVI